MSAPQYPVVTRLQPDPELLNDHHGPPQKGSKIALSDSAKPKYFQNPWKSWRSPSLSDAWTAYQKGAAIALPIRETPKRFTHAGAEGGANDSSDGDSDGSPKTPQDDEEEDKPLPRGPDGAIRKDNSGWILPGSLYIRPEFSEISDQDEADDWRDPPVEVIRPKWEELQGDKEDVTWLGHAGVMVRIPWKKVDGGKNREGSCGVLFDPIFSYRCSPSQYVGPARYQDSPCAIADLPPVHVCLISHDHYDHLDYYSIVDVWKYHQETVHFFVPFGLAQWFIATGISEDRVTEMDWWSESILSFPAPSSSSSPLDASDDQSQRNGVDETASLNLKVVCTPAQHRSGRGVMDHMKTLWASWCIGVIEKEDADKAEERGMLGWKGFKLYFGGDTGFRYATAPEEDEDAICPAFQQISDLYAPMSLCLLPLSTGSSLPFLRTVLSLSLDQYTLTSSQHCSPGDSLDIHLIMKSARSVGIHWGTFCDLDEARGTRVDFGRARRERRVGDKWDGSTTEKGGSASGPVKLDEEGSDRGVFVTCDIGETLVLP